MAELSRWGDDHPDRLGGVWWEYTAEPKGSVKMCLGVIGDAAAVAAQVRPVLAHPDHLNVVAQRYTLRELRRLADIIFEDQITRWEALWESGRYASEEEFWRSVRESPVIVGADVNPEINKVGVGVAPRDSTFAAAVINRYGADRVHVFWEPIVTFW
ncbi:hypothetical protein ACFWYW_56090 [Nonomuraea sp. NPDC059023]|uniref:hypothetical protein n=1 Tax=unclassified Nonomuraea TaxID=2593643 RepID=UPI003692ADC1